MNIRSNFKTKVIETNLRFNISYLFVTHLLYHHTKMFMTDYDLLTSICKLKK